MSELNLNLGENIFRSHGVNIEATDGNGQNVKYTIAGKPGSWTVTCGDTNLTFETLAAAQKFVENDIGPDGSINDISRPKAPPPFPTNSKLITDDDIRGLMNLLLQAFTLMVNAQRQGDLNDMQGQLSALKTKTDEMTKAKDAAYDAAMTQAIGQIVSGSLTLASAGFQAYCAGKSCSALANDPSFQASGKVGEGAKAVTEISQGTASEIGHWDQLSKVAEGAAQGSGAMITGICGTVSAGQTAEQQQAEIDKELASAQLEFWKQGESMDEKAMESLFNFLKTILAILQEYRQNATNAENAVVRSA
ncbi:MAG: hypothetical protein LBJ78_00060 [Puniceicoccales bacterium]|jgi:hypothetical protein|nr:hypothetical protein [Puniceicoccales bacterium]